MHPLFSTEWERIEYERERALKKRAVEMDALVEAMWQLLDDMGRDGQSVCMQAKAMARIAYEPFKEVDTPLAMPLDEAERIVRACQ